MKILKFTISLLLVFVSYTNGFAQDVTFLTQEQVDAFDPSITTISGKLTIGSVSYINSNTITNLDNLSNITTVASNVIITYNPVLTNIDGLSNLSAVNGNGGIVITHNPVLANIDGLSSLFAVNRLNIFGNDALINIDGLSNLSTVNGYVTIRSNPLLANVNGLSNLSSVDSDFNLWDHSLLANINGLSNLSFVGGDIDFSDNELVTNLDGFSNLSSVGGYFLIADNPVLVDIGGLLNLTSVGALAIAHNNILENIDGLLNLTSVGENLYINYNDALLNLNGLSNLTSVGMDLYINYNDVLSNLDALSNLTSIGRRLVIEENPALTNLDGLSNLTSVGGVLKVNYNSVLTNCCGIQDLLATPGAIGGNVTLGNNPSECSSTTEILSSLCIYPIYVDETATGNNDGSSWANAFTDLQDALALVTDQEIHIAAGTYKPTTTTLRGASFELHTGVTLLGGFPNGGGMRDPDSNTTILSGEIDNITGYTGNSYHVVKIINAENVVIDGVDIKDGNADDSNTFSRARGGGIYSKGSKFTLSNVTVRGNRGIYGGAVFASLSPEVRIVDSEIILNRADYGSAVFHSNETNLYLERTRVIDNNSLVRCAIEVNNSLYTEIDNCLIANNASANANAISLVATNRDQTCIIRNSTIIGETKNKSLVTVLVGYGDELDLTIDNSIVAHQNLAFDKNVNVVSNGVLNFIHNNCYFQGSSVTGSGNNTLFSDTDGDLQLNADYSVNHCSPVVNAGNNSFSLSTTDINGNTRISDTTVDMGAYEAQTVCSSLVRKSEDLEIFDSGEVRVYPNPVENTLHIQTDLVNPTFHIFDLLGKKVLDTNKRDIFLAELPTGIYILRIMEGNELIESLKVIKE